MTVTAAGDSALATGIPGSQDHLLPQYGALLFAINAFSVWHCPNNSSIYAEVPALLSCLSQG